MRLIITLMILVVVIIFGIYNKDRLSGLMHPIPENIFSTNFVTDISEIKNLTGGGVPFVDNWIRFQSDRPVRIQQENNFSLIECQEPATWFISQLRSLNDLADKENLVCLELKNNEGKRWFIYNSANKTYFFRFWR